MQDEGYNIPVTGTSQQSLEHPQESSYVVLNPLFLTHSIHINWNSDHPFLLVASVPLHSHCSPLESKHHSISYSSQDTQRHLDLIVSFVQRTGTVLVLSLQPLLHVLQVPYQFHDDASAHRNSHNSFVKTAVEHVRGHALFSVQSHAWYHPSEKSVSGSALQSNLCVVIESL